MKRGTNEDGESFLSNIGEWEIGSRDEVKNIPFILNEEEVFSYPTSSTTYHLDLFLES